MRLDMANTLHRARLPVVTFQCAGCDGLEHGQSPQLPKGWGTEQVGDDHFAYCPTCAVKLPAPRKAPR